jgi:hypothetical protein
MKPKEHFNDFYAEFSRLAEEANIPMLYRKRDLYSKLPYLLQGHMISSVNKDTTDIEKFVKKCQAASYDIGLMQKGRATFRGTQTASPVTRSESRSTPFVKKEQLSSASPSAKTYLTSAERLALMKEGRCFHCRELGHMTMECLKKKPVLASVTTAAAVATRDQQGAKEASQSGNAEA